MTTLLILVASLLAAVLPTSLYVLIVWWFDRHEKEPLQLLAAAFLWGAVPAVLLAVGIELASDAPVTAFSGSYGEIVGASVVAPVVEEAIKASALVAIIVLVPGEFDGVLDGVIYGSIVGLGFAMTENVIYYVSAWGEGGVWSWSAIVMGRALVFGFTHAMFTSLTGIGLGLARGHTQPGVRWLYAAGGLVAAILAHLFHNLFLAAGEFCILSLLTDWLGLFLVVAIAVMARRHEQQWIRAELAEEVRLGVLTPDQYQNIITRRTTGPAPWRALARDAVELAIKRHQYARLGGGRGNRWADIVALRQRLVARRRALGDAAVERHRVCLTCGVLGDETEGACCRSCGAPWTQPTAREQRGEVG